MFKVHYPSFDLKAEETIRYIRHTVFSLEQDVDTDIDFDGQDKDAVHVLITEDSRPVATGRMLEDGHIGRVAVLKEYRGLGVGSLVIESLEGVARRNSYPRIYLGSQLHAIPFYSKLGFSPYGEQYTEANIEHISMEKPL